MKIDIYVNFTGNLLFINIIMSNVIWCDKNEKRNAWTLFNL